MKITNSQESIP